MSMTTFAAYSHSARSTDLHNFASMQIPPLAYLALALAGEAGELANKVKKLHRDNSGHLTEDRKTQIRDEMGDVLWYLDALARALGYEDLGPVAISNLAKLQSRRDRGVVGGEGDNR